MHSWFVLLLFSSLIINAISRPRHAEYNNDSIEEPEEEEENDFAAEAYSADDEDTGLSDHEPAGQEVPRSRHSLDLTDNRYLQRNSPEEHTARAKPDSLLDVKINSNRRLREENPNEPANINEQLRYQKRRQSNRYSDSNDEQQEIQQHLTNREVSKSNHVQNPENQVNKRIEYENTVNEEGGDMIFEKNREQASRINKKEYNTNEISDTDQLRYFNQFRNSMQAENREIPDDKTQGGVRYNLRGRREVTEENPPDISNLPNSEGNKESNDKTDSADEESAIKRHVKKMSSEELEQLLNSLTGEKRELLKKIIDDSSSSDYGYINKREITKKAGAVEENNFIENCQSDLSKVQGGSSSLDLNTESPSSVATETTEVSSNKAQESSDATAKTSESSLTAAVKLDLPSNSDDALLKKADSNLNTFALNIDTKNQLDVANVANSQVTSKVENKREANLEELEESAEDAIDESKVSGHDYANEQGYFQDESMSNLLDDDSQPNDDKIFKREALYEKQADVSDSVKSLEESFPNANAYDDSGPYTGPLIRVKRKNYDQVVKKRSAGLLPDAKVAYFPYKAENEDEDNDEGNEFDDEGFYDRTSNFANNNKAIENIAEKSESVQSNIVRGDNPKALNENEESNTSLGSDTDSVLSGVEGVDDNLMYISATRGRRTPEDNSRDMAKSKPERSPSLSEDEIKASPYQENEAFGPLPRNYDGDLSRYKRIRRVKQLRNGQELNSADTE